MSDKANVAEINQEQGNVNQEGHTV